MTPSFKTTKNNKNKLNYTCLKFKGPIFHFVYLNFDYFFRHVWLIIK